MIASTSDGQVVLVREPAASLRLVRHRDVPVAQPANSAQAERPRNIRLDVAPLHHPTAAECYGCVDWFQF